MRRAIRLAAVVLVAGIPVGCARTVAEPPANTPTTASSSSASLSPAPPAVAGRAVSFPADGGVVLRGVVYGQGRTAVLLSNMGDNDPGPWQRFAPLLAARGYRVLSYSFRYAPTAPFNATAAGDTVRDASAAIAYLRSTGADRIVLIGASLGGMASAKASTSTAVAGLIVLSSPAELTGYGLVVTSGDLGSAAPKLFVAIDADPAVPPAATRALYDLAAPPKQWRTFPGTAHGVRSFEASNGAEIRAALVDFVTSETPAS